MSLKHQLENIDDVPKRSDEPIWWVLFSAGGVCFAVVFPGLIVSLAFLMPMGIVSAELLEYERIRGFLFDSFRGLAGLMFAGAAICLPLFHAAHRIHHGLHDLKVPYPGVSKTVSYGTAFLLSALTLTIWGVGLGW